jgi:hypothetical protein
MLELVVAVLVVTVEVWVAVVMLELVVAVLVLKVEVSVVVAVAVELVDGQYLINPASQTSG